MIDTVVTTLFCCLLVSTWFAAERSPQFLRSLNTTLVYMKLVLLVYSLFHGPYVLIACIVLDIIQACTNLEKEIKEDNETTWKFVLFLVAKAWLVCFLVHQEPSVVILNGNMIRVMYLLEALDIEDGLPYVAFLFMGLEVRNIFNNEDQAIIIRVILIIINSFGYPWLTMDFFDLAKIKYVYNDDLLPGSFVKAFIREEDFMSKETSDYILNRTKSFFSYVSHGENKVLLPPTLPPTPSVIDAIKTLQASIDKHNGDPTVVVTWINTTKQLLIFYVQSQLQKEQDETKRVTYETFLLQNDPTRKRSNAIHESGGEEETKELLLNVVVALNQEEILDKKETPSISEEEEEEDSTDKEEQEHESSSDREQIL